MMLSQVKRKRNLFLALTLTVLFTGSILAFSIQAVYSTADYNSSRSNTSTSIATLEDSLIELKIDAKILGDANMILSIDNMLMELKEVKNGLDAQAEFFSVMNDELKSLKQGLKSDGNEVAVESIPQTTESAAEKGAYSNITLERIDFAKGFVVLDDLQNVAPILYGNVCTAQGSCETLSNDNLLVIISKSMLGDTTSDKLEEYLKVMLSNARTTSIVENERTTSTKVSPQDDFELTKSAVAPRLQPEDIKPKVPNWIMKNAGWYAEGLITEDDFVKGLEWMINNGVIEIQNQEEIVK